MGRERESRTFGRRSGTGFEYVMKKVGLGKKTKRHVIHATQTVETAYDNRLVCF